MRLRRGWKPEKFDREFNAQREAAEERLDGEFANAPLPDQPVHLLMSASAAGNEVVTSWLEQMVALRYAPENLNEELGSVGAPDNPVTALRDDDCLDFMVACAVDLPREKGALYRAIRAAAWLYATEYWSYYLPDERGGALANVRDCGLIANRDLAALTELGNYVAGETEGDPHAKFNRRSLEWVLASAYEADWISDAKSGAQEMSPDLETLLIWSWAFTGPGHHAFQRNLNDLRERYPEAYGDAGDDKGR